MRPLDCNCPRPLLRPPCMTRPLVKRLAALPCPERKVIRESFFSFFITSVAALALCVLLSQCYSRCYTLSCRCQTFLRGEGALVLAWRPTLTLRLKFICAGHVHTLSPLPARALVTLRTDELAQAYERVGCLVLTHEGFHLLFPPPSSVEPLS